MALTIAAGTEPHADDPPDQTASARSPRPARRRSLLDRYSGLFVLAALVVVFSILRPDTFLTVRTLRGLAADQAVTAIAAIGLSSWRSRAARSTCPSAPCSGSRSSW